MANVYLVTGVAGTGKSTLERIFAAKGYDTEEIDRGFASWQDQNKNTVPSPVNESTEWYKKHDWLTLETPLLERIERAAEAPSPLLFFGNTGNLCDYSRHFEKIFLLEYLDEATIAERIHTRTGNNYGKDPVEFQAILSYYQFEQNEYRALGAIPIDCTLPLEEIAAIIESEITRT